MFFQEPTPDTSGYMIAGYAIAFIVMALYVASMYIRSRNLNRDMTMLEEMEKSAPPFQTAAMSKPMNRPTKSKNNRSGKHVTKKSGKK